MPKVPLIEEERSPNPPRTNLMEVLPLKAIMNHPYQSYKKKHHHIDKHGKTIQRSTLLPHLESNKVLGRYSQECC
jgi:hypothetical protein